jgi:hypothetical protein
MLIHHENDIVLSSRQFPFTFIELDCSTPRVNASIRATDLASSAYFSYNFVEEHSVACGRFIGVYSVQSSIYESIFVARQIFLWLG